MAAVDDADKVSASFTGKRGRSGWWVREKKKNKKDNFGKSLDPGAISTQNM